MVLAIAGCTYRLATIEMQATPAAVADTNFGTLAAVRISTNPAAAAIAPIAIASRPCPPIAADNSGTNRGALISNAASGKRARAGHSLITPAAISPPTPAVAKKIPIAADITRVTREADGAAISAAR